MKKWILSRSGLETILLPPAVSDESEFHSNRTWYLMLFMLLLTAAGNICHLLLTIEIVSVLFLNRYIILQPLAYGLGWIAIDFEAAAQGVTTRSNLGSGLLMVLALPTLITVFTWLLLILWKLLDLITLIMRPQPSEIMKKYVDRVSNTLGIDAPILLTTRKERFTIETKMPWIFGKPIVCVSQAVLDTFTESEMKAALAHELAHIRYDVSTIRITRWLSLVLLFPCNVFALLLNSESRETRADRTAIELIGNSHLLAKAVLKASITFSSDNQKTTCAKKKPEPVRHSVLIALWQKFRTYQRLMWQLLYPESIQGYSHPNPRDRLIILSTMQISQTD